MREFESSTKYKNEGVAEKILNDAGWNVDLAKAMFQTIPKDKLPKNENETNAAIASSTGNTVIGGGYLIVYLIIS